MRTINHNPMNIRTVIRPRIEVVKYEDQDAYTFQVVFNESIKTRKGAFTLADAKKKARAFKDFFNRCAEEIECGQERPYQIMGTVKDMFDSQYTPQARHSTDDF